MEYGYYPGCTLKNHAQNFEDAALLAMEKLGHPLTEMKDWVCCGTVFSQTTDDLMLQLAAIRNLLRAEHQGYGKLITLCSMCYNTLQRARDFIKDDPENLDKVNQFMYKEPISYTGNVEVIHLLSLLQNEITWESIAKQVVKPLKNLKIGGYYGCMLLRPKEYAIDDFEDPVILENFIEATGAESVVFPYRLECCGAYQTVTNKDITVKRTFELIESARDAGCEAIITSCPLCAFNMDQRQKETAEEFSQFVEMPVFYFTELLALALGVEWNSNWSKLHYVNPEPYLKAKGLI
ncbi:MAG: CoB--CoM heterodisulfide reductase iron-sulfur subunit B family protein [Candidatus Cloacimonetes bacterium]|nr:CoB--CoM heterodisulfide reductase iron-sulfur subunit B family protein [Candidatus Cloacimonadota bacterium]